jgi:hypothetical protein
MFDDYCRHWIEYGIMVEWIACMFEDYCRQWIEYGIIVEWIACMGCFRRLLLYHNTVRTVLTVEDEFLCTYETLTSSMAYYSYLHPITYRQSIQNIVYLV